MIPSQVRIFVCTERQDMRRSFDALALAVRERLALDPESGALFVFASKRGNRLKVLWFDHNGYCLLYKRLHRALFSLPERHSCFGTDLQRSCLAASVHPSRAGPRRMVGPCHPWPALDIAGGLQCLARRT